MNFLEIQAGRYHERKVEHHYMDTGAAGGILLRHVLVCEQGKHGRSS